MRRARHRVRAVVTPVTAVGPLIWSPHSGIARKRIRTFTFGRVSEPSRPCP